MEKQNSQFVIEWIYWKRQQDAERMQERVYAPLA